MVDFDEDFTAVFLFSNFLINLMSSHIVLIFFKLKFKKIPSFQFWFYTKYKKKEKMKTSLKAL